MTRAARLLLASALLVTAGQARADVITSLYDTGVDNSGTALSIGSIDPHYTLNGGAAFVQSPQNTGEYATTWITSPTVPWIGPTDDHSNVSDLILYNYTTTFNLPSNANLASVVLDFTLASDNAVTVYVNGNDTGLPGVQSEFLAFTSFGVDGTDSPFFTTGTNTLTFSVENGPGFGPNPTGLLITSIQGSYSLVPEPSTAVPVLTGAAVLVAYAWRARIRATG